MANNNHVYNNENPPVCSKCGGQCCKNYGGAFHPLDFGDDLTIDSIREILTERDDVALDWYENVWDYVKPRGYFLRMRHKSAPIVDPSYGGVCVHLTENGCDLPFDKRAYGCKRLRPSTRPKDECIGEYGKREAFEDWDRFNDILDILHDEFVRE